MEKSDKLRKVEEELLSTERTYVAHLSFVCEELVVPLRQRQLLPEEELRAIFSNIEILLNYHKELLSNLTAAQGQDLAAQIVLMIPFFKNYIAYINNYGGSLHQLSVSCKRITGLATFFEQSLKNPRCGGLSLSSLLIVPVQRLPRYELLMKELLHYAPAHTASEYESSLAKIRTINQQVNAAAKKCANLSSVFRFDVSIPDLPATLLEPHRYFLRKERLRKLTAQGQSQLKWCFLFNDALLWVDEIMLPFGGGGETKSAFSEDIASSSLLSRRFMFSGSVPLRYVTKVVDTPDSSDSTEHNTFELVTLGRTWVFRTDSKGSKAEWLADCRKAVEEAKELDHPSSYWARDTHKRTWCSCSPIRLVMLLLFIVACIVYYEVMTLVVSRGIGLGKESLLRHFFK